MFSTTQSTVFYNTVYCVVEHIITCFEHHIQCFATQYHKLYSTVYHVLPHTMFYRKWNCFRWRDFLERERLRRTFIHRHLKFSNGTERLLPDDPNWTVDEGHNTPRGGGSSSRKTGSSRGKYNSYTHWWLNITKLVQNLCYR